MPSETIRAVEFIRSASDDQIRRIWGVRLRAAEDLVRSRAPAHARWNARIPGSIPAASGKFQTAAAKQLLHHLNVGVSALIGQFAYGFPIAGKLSQAFLFPSGKKSDDRLPVSEIFDSPAARFRGRSAKFGLKNDAPLRPDAMGQAKEGWLLHPVPLSHDGKPLLWSSRQYNVSFRFGVPQADKLRPCDDLKHSIKNLTCTVGTPIQLLSWDNIAQISAMLAAGGGDWVMFKADHKAAYKQLPIDPADQNTAIISLRRPTEHRWYGFLTRTLIFGSVAAVLHYNVLPRLMVVLVKRYLGIPPVGRGVF